MSNTQEWMSANAVKVVYRNAGQIVGDDFSNDAPALLLDCGSGCEVVIEGSAKALINLATRIQLMVRTGPSGEVVDLDADAKLDDAIEQATDAARHESRYGE